MQTLLSLLQQEFATCLTIIYDPLLALSSSHIDICQFEGISRAMESTFSCRNVPLRFACRSTREMRQFLHNCRFEQTLSMNMHQILSACFPIHSAPEEATIPLSSELMERARIDDKDGGHTKTSTTVISHRTSSSLVEPFDEFASLAALHRIYSISCACNSEVLFDKFVHRLFNGNRNVSMNIAKYTGRKEWHDAEAHYEIREANCNDANVMDAIFSECHADYVALYSSVRSHVKHSKQVIYDTLQRSHSKLEHTCRQFYVAEDLRTHAGNVFIRDGTIFFV